VISGGPIAGLKTLVRKSSHAVEKDRKVNGREFCLQISY